MGALKTIKFETFAGMSKVVAVAALTMVLAACGGSTSDAKDAQNMEGEGNTLIESSKATRADMHTKYGIYLRPGSDMSEDWTGLFIQAADEYDYSKIPAAEVPAVRARLEKHMSEVGRVAEIARHKNMKASFDPVQCDREIQVTKRYVQNLKELETTGVISRRSTQSRSAQYNSNDGSKKRKKTYR